MPFQKGHKINLGKKHSKETKWKISSALKGSIPWNKDKKGVMPIAWNKGLTKDNNTSLKKISDKLIGKRLSKEHIRAMSKSLKGKIPWNKDKHTGNYGNGFKKGQIAWNRGIIGEKSHSFGHKNYVTDKDQRRKNALLGRLALQNHKGYTSLEKIIYEFFKNNNIEFESQKLINNKFLVDAFVPKNNLIIECDGNYWHSLERVRRKDKAENAYLTKCGFNLLRLQESEILNGNYERRLLKCL